MMAIQEPPINTEANCVFVYFSKAKEIGAQRPKGKRVSAVAVYAARDLRPGEELFVHYGSSKARDYNVGEPASDPVYKYEIKPEEYPCAWLQPGCFAPMDGWRDA